MVKPLPAVMEQIKRTDSHGIWVGYVNDQGGVWHYHPEFEIMLNIKCNGTRIVGDSIELFDSYDLVLIPGDIPHCWNYYRDGASLPPKHGIMAHFHRSIFGESMLYQHEFNKIRELLDDSRRGISFPEDEARSALKYMEGMVSHSGIEKIIDFLSVLHIMCSSKRGRKLSSENYRVDQDEHKEKEMADAYNYIREYYRKPISLEEISSITGMKPCSFSKSFKRYSGSGFVEYVNQVRTTRACYLLRESKSAIRNIADECGFSSISNFNKQFRKIMGLSPKAYREQYAIRN